MHSLFITRKANQKLSFCDMIEGAHILLLIEEIYNFQLIPAYYCIFIKPEVRATHKVRVLQYQQ